MPERVRTIVSMGLFVILSGFVAFSAIGLGWLLWLRITHHSESLVRFPAWKT